MYTVLPASSETVRALGSEQHSSVTRVSQGTGTGTWAPYLGRYRLRKATQDKQEPSIPRMARPIALGNVFQASDFMRTIQGDRQRRPSLFPLPVCTCTESRRRVWLQGRSATAGCCSRDPWMMGMCRRGTELGWGGWIRPPQNIRVLPRTKPLVDDVAAHHSAYVPFSLRLQPVLGYEVHTLHTRLYLHLRLHHPFPACCRPRLHT
ncbi:hypothetical protein B0T24DRAFT_70240 [Lasiosphaeria ovina]|uniref:Uncharacterized protein n=1 Tax=Lasiosphaeria ovina TaxID=92902 RepID=A0AAE0NM09_9PEZI|nr:hypothetical protein B0T24DRAFT_70240 [Lasiosphaeria ovina]